MASLLAAGLPGCGNIFPGLSEINQGVQAIIYLKYDISAFTAVSAVRSAVGDIQFPPEADMSVTAFSGLNKYLRAICKHGSPYLSEI